jgi:sugar (pentulose or hexulose) kinase
MSNKTSYILAIDAGTGSGRAVLFDSRGNQISVGQEEWTHKSDPRYPNSMEFDVVNNWKLLCRCIRHACDEGGISPSSIVAVSATSMREGIVLYNLEQIFSFTGLQTDSIVFAGGASNGPLWCQILADVTGKRVRVPVVKEATALGGAIAAGVGIGLYDSMVGAADELVRWEKDYEPDTQNYLLYQEVRQKWVQAYAAQRALVDDGVTQSMWKAPGLWNDD